MKCFSTFQVHPYTITLQRLCWFLAILGDRPVEMMPWCHGLCCRPLQSDSGIHIGHTWNVSAPFNVECRHISAPLHSYTDEAGIDLELLSDSGNKMKPWCHGWGCRPLWLLSTSILDINEVVYHFSMRYVGILVHPYTITQQRLGWISVILGDWQVEMMPWCHDLCCRPLYRLLCFNIHIGRI